MLEGPGPPGSRCSPVLFPLLFEEREHLPVPSSDPPIRPAPGPSSRSGLLFSWGSDPVAKGGYSSCTKRPYHTSPRKKKATKQGALINHKKKKCQNLQSRLKPTWKASPPTRQPEPFATQDGSEIDFTLLTCESHPCQDRGPTFEGDSLTSSCALRSGTQKMTAIPFFSLPSSAMYMVSLEAMVGYVLSKATPKPQFVSLPPLFFGNCYFLSCKTTRIYISH